MIRILIPLLLFMLPFAIYGMFILLRQSPTKTAGQALSSISPTSLLVLSFLGVFLAAVGVGLLGTLISKEHASRYEPPRLTSEGRLIPGQFVTKSEEENAGSSAGTGTSADKP